MKIYYKKGEVLMTWCNEVGFQPRDLSSLCDVGASIKQSQEIEGEKIGRKGIGFKSIFALTNMPMIISPPFQVS